MAITAFIERGKNEMSNMGRVVLVADGQRYGIAYGWTGPTPETCKEYAIKGAEADLRAAETKRALAELEYERASARLKAVRAAELQSDEA